MLRDAKEALRVLDRLEKKRLSKETTSRQGPASVQMCFRE